MGAMYYHTLLLLMVSLVQAKKGPCFEFTWNSFLEFQPNNFNISHSAHYSLQFHTKSWEGIVMYTEGPDDYEALFLSEGKLTYLLTNPSPSGVEGTSGGLYTSNDVVNNGSWMAVDLWRNWETEENHLNNKQLVTGLRIRDVSTGVVETHVDDMKHRGVLLNPTVFFGGVASYAKHTQGTASPNFMGEIKEIHEERNDVDFDVYIHNFRGKVSRCS